MSGDSIASPTFCPKDSGTSINENKKASSCFICQQLSILHLAIYFIEPLHRLGRHLGLLLLGIDRSVEKHLPVWIDDLESGLSVRVVVAQFAPLAITDHISGGTI